VLGARRVDRLETLAEEIRSGGAEAVVVETDVTDADQVKRLVDAAVESFG
ncbi:MAG: SDR family NAD(P)-dependent oxidoreductase, partial [Gammaproteobacteria bacterium]|nr:SDR family NAD(P)-dependent oxidoreductase [Gammaproteobacteria bacterium]